MAFSMKARKKMSVLIKGMEMPQSCYDCPLAGDFKCNLMPSIPALCKEYDMAVQNGKRLNNCPLVEIPPHGRLIDADEMKESIRKQTAFLRLIGGEFAEIAETIEKGFLQEIDNAPTIIEAEEEET